MRRKVLLLVSMVVMLTGVWGTAGSVYAKTVEAGAHSSDHNRRRDDQDDDCRYYPGGPGTNHNNSGCNRTYNSAYGYPGGPGTTGNYANSSTLGYGTPAVSGSNSGSTTYYTGTWKQDANGWWYQFSNGTYPKNCWTVIDGSYYCFDANGYRRYGWIYWNNKWYYCGTDGALLANTYTPDGYYVGSDGVWVR
jgi:hypothetical protein